MCVIGAPGDVTTMAPAEPRSNVGDFCPEEQGSRKNSDTIQKPQTNRPPVGALWATVHM